MIPFSTKTFYKITIKFELSIAYDALFRIVFNNKISLLSLYNAINDTCYDNPNILLLGAIYLLELYKRYVDQRKLNIYSNTLQKIPTPKYVVFYNRTKAEPDCCTMRLSDAFETPGGCLECEATMLNINFGHNRELMEKCRPLEEYSIFVDKIRQYSADQTLTLEEAIQELMKKLP